MARARRLTLKGEYLGGHPDAEKHRPGSTMVVTDSDITVRWFKSICVPWSDVTGVTVEGPEQAEQRLTMTRLVTLNIFAFAAKKTTSQALVQVDTRHGWSVLFMVPKTSAGVLRTQFAPWTAKLPRHR